MSTTKLPARPQGDGKMLRVVALLLVAVLAELAIGEWAGRAPSKVRPEATSAEGLAPDRGLAESAAPFIPPAAVSQVARPATLPAVYASAPRAAPPDVVSRVAAEAKGKLEALRSYITASCWKSGGAAPSKAKLTFNLTFDAAGREIARGISEDRRAPAGEFGRCLRGLHATVLEIAPPGANVGVSIPVVFP